MPELPVHIGGQFPGIADIIGDRNRGIVHIFAGGIGILSNLQGVKTGLQNFSGFTELIDLIIQSHLLIKLVLNRLDRVMYVGD